jgi:hypothetical protein
LLLLWLLLPLFRGLFPGPRRSSPATAAIPGLLVAFLIASALGGRTLLSIVVVIQKMMLLNALEISGGWSVSGNRLQSRRRSGILRWRNPRNMMKYANIAGSKSVNLPRCA